MKEEKKANLPQKEENQEMIEKKEWQTPELSIIDTDDTLFTANPGNDGVATVS